MNTYFISDLHFGHRNVIRYDNRPFSAVDEMDNAMITLWNEEVTDEDVVWILGDVSWYGVRDTVKILKQLKGKKNLCIGNHDHSLLKSPEFREQFCEITNYKEITLDNGKGIVLSHYPIPCFNHHYHGWYHLYGHVHSGFEENIMQSVRREMEALYEVPCMMFNVGCMMPDINYVPTTLEEIKWGKEWSRH